MTLIEFVNTNWHRGNKVMLQNGKEYLVKGVKGHGKYLLLYSEEYDSNFVADHYIVERRTSDYEEPEEVYLEMKRQKQAAAEALRAAEREERLRRKAEIRQKHIEEQHRAHEEAMARKAAKAAAKAARKEVEAAAAAAKKAAAKPAPKPVAKAAPVAKPAPKPAVAKPAPVAKETPKPAEPAAPVADSPRKRIRQRIKVMTSKIEKVEIFKKK